MCIRFIIACYQCTLSIVVYFHLIICDECSVEVINLARFASQQLHTSRLALFSRDNGSSSDYACVVLSGEATGIIVPIEGPELALV